MKKFFLRYPDDLWKTATVWVHDPLYLEAGGYECCYDSRDPVSTRVGVMIHTAYFNSLACAFGPIVVKDDAENLEEFLTKYIEYFI